VKNIKLSRLLKRIATASCLSSSAIVALFGFSDALSVLLGSAIIVLAHTWYFWRITDYYRLRQIGKGQKQSSQLVYAANNIDSNTALRLYYRAEVAKIIWVVLALSTIIILDRKGILASWQIPDLQLTALFSALALTQLLIVVSTSAEIANSLKQPDLNKD